LPGLPSGTPALPHAFAPSVNHGTHLDPAKHVIVTPNGERTALAMPLSDGKVGMIPVPPLIQRLPFGLQQTYAQQYAEAYQDALEEQGPTTLESSQSKRRDP